jgi:hypothetical protein
VETSGAHAAAAAGEGVFSPMLTQSSDVSIPCSARKSKARFRAITQSNTSCRSSSSTWLSIKSIISAWISSSVTSAPSDGRYSREYIEMRRAIRALAPQARATLATF